MNLSQILLSAIAATVATASAATTATATTAAASSVATASSAATTATTATESTSIATAVTTTIATAVTTAVTTTITASVITGTTLATSLSSAIAATITAAIKSLTTIIESDVIAIGTKFIVVALCNGQVIFEAEFFQRTATRQLNTIVVVNVDHDDFHRIPNATNGIHAGNITARQLTDVYQTVLARKNFYERTEVPNTSDHTVINLANLNGCSASFNATECSLRRLCV
jgi:hypothetical protein